MKKKAFISGAITSDPDYKRKFACAERMLADSGYVVINPTVLPLGLTDGEYLQICYTMIDICDIFVQLPDWRKSDGALKEYEYVKALRGTHETRSIVQFSTLFHKRLETTMKELMVKFDPASDSPKYMALQYALELLKK